MIAQLKSANNGGVAFLTIYLLKWYIISFCSNVYRLSYAVVIKRGKYTVCTVAVMLNPMRHEDNLLCPEFHSMGETWKKVVLRKEKYTNLG